MPIAKMIAYAACVLNVVKNPKDHWEQMAIRTDIVLRLTADKYLLSARNPNKSLFKN